MDFYFEDFRMKNTKLEEKRLADEAFQKEQHTLLIEQAAELKLVRELDYINALSDACNREFKKDRFRALTEPLCATIFKERGLP